MSYYIYNFNRAFKLKYGVDINPDNRLIKECIRILILERKNKRICFECKKDLNFTEYIIGNLNLFHNNLEYLIDIWLNPIIQLYCCTCYQVEKALQTLIKLTEKLNEVK